MLRLRIALVVFWAILWCVSLSLPVVMMGPNPDHAWRGVIVLMLGWAGIPSQLGWLANLTLPGVAVLSLVRDAPVVLRVGAAVVQIGLAVNALFWDWVADEGGVRSIEAFGPGYYLWLGVMVGSAVVLLAVTMSDVRRSKSASYRINSRGAVD